MHHLALNGTRAHDGHLDDQVVIVARPQARQHRHLRTGLDLKHPGRLGAADHVVDGAVLARHRREREFTGNRGGPAEIIDELEGTADRAQHAEAEHIDLEQTECIEIILVPLDHGAIGHGGVLDRHEFVETPARDHETADVLREVPRKAEQFGGKRD